MRTLSKNYSGKLFIFCLLLSITPVVILGYYSYSKSSAAVQEVAKMSNLRMVEQMQAGVEQVLRVVDYSAIQFIQSTLLERSMSIKREKAHTDPALYSDLMQSINSLPAYALGIDNVYLVNLAQGWFAHSSGMRDLQELSLLKEWQEFITLNKPFYWQAVSDGEGLPASAGVYLVKPIPINTNEPEGLFILKFSAVELYSLLRVDPYGETIILDGQQHVIAHSDKKQIGSDYSTQPFLRQFSGDSGYKVVRSEEGPFGVTYRQSAYNGWIYISKVSLTDLNREARSIGWVTVGLCAGIAVVIALFALIGSKRLYSPIRRLYELVSHPAHMEHTAPGKQQDEFSYIGDVFTQLRQKQLKLNQQLDNYMVMKLLQGTVRSQELQEKLKNWQDPLGWQLQAVMAIQIDTIENTQYTDQDRDLLLFAISNIASEKLPRHMRLSPIILNESQVTIVGSEHGLTDIFQSEIHEWAASVQTAAEHYLKLSVSVGISRLYCEWEQIPQAYAEAVDALKYRLRLGQRAILYLDDIAPRGNQDIFLYPVRLEAELLDAIKLNNSEQAHRLLEQLVTHIVSREMSLTEYHMHFMRLMMDILGLIQDPDETSSMINMDDSNSLEQLRELKLVQEIIQWFRDKLIDPVMAFLEQRRSEQYSSISDEVLKMIHENLVQRSVWSYAQGV
ncbi:hypothetical protein AB4Z45_32380 [Paenibacillus sp. MCAF9]|uniref:PDC sensor domain-containing protein n=1 Tax=Paenibacillus sp. MCAF9 TaxID=3233046 RepID=UPI003F9D813E